MAELLDDVKAGEATTVADASNAEHTESPVSNDDQAQAFEGSEAVSTEPTALDDSTISALSEAMAEEQTLPNATGIASQDLNQEVALASANANANTSPEAAENEPPSSSVSQPSLDLDPAVMASEQAKDEPIVVVTDENDNAIAAVTTDQEATIITASPALQADLDTSMTTDDNADTGDQPSAAVQAASEALHAVSDGIVSAVNTFHPALGASDEVVDQEQESGSADSTAQRLQAVLKQFQSCMSVEQLKTYAQHIKTTTPLNAHANQVLGRAFGRRKAELLTGEIDSVPWEEDYQMIVRHTGPSTEPTIPPPPQPKLYDIWQAMFHRADYVAFLRNEAVATVLRSRPFRSVSWRLFLGALPEDRSTWGAALAESRAAYTTLRNTLTVDPRASGDGDKDNHPLTEAEKMAWHQHFVDQELREIIMRDVTRTFPEEPFFESAAIQTMMADLLFVYSKLHSDVSYRQGMHELLAALLLVVAKEAEMLACNEDMQGDQVSADVKEEMFLVLSQDYAEHDTYTLFACLMKDMKPFFMSDAYQRPEDPGRSQQKFAFDPFGKIFEDKKAAQDAREAADQAVDNQTLSPLQKKLNWIQYSLLGQAEPELLQKLRALDIPPQIYGLRWVRLLLSREFNLPETLIIWDALFAEGMVLIDYLCVALLVYIKDYVLSHDYTECLMLLMRFPTVPDVQSLVQKALHLKAPTRFPDPSDWHFDPSGGAQPPRQDEAASLMGVFSYAAHRAQEFVGNYVPALAPSENDGPHSPLRRVASTSRQAASTEDLIQEDFNSLRECNMRLGEKLAHSIETIQSELRRSSATHLKVLDRAAVQLALLQLHQVQDVLEGRLPPDMLGFPRTADDQELRVTSSMMAEAAQVHNLRDTTIPAPKPQSPPTASPVPQPQSKRQPQRRAQTDAPRRPPAPGPRSPAARRRKGKAAGPPPKQPLAVLHAGTPEPETVFVPDTVVLHLADEEERVERLSSEQVAMRMTLAMARLPLRQPASAPEDA
eukprot:m.169146 g.169146  ORF g.169146 m.169146 type:complete len:1000 (-) comp16666_c0_seq2:79-3078(-)